MLSLLVAAQALGSDPARTCPRLPYTHEDLNRFEAADADFQPKSFDLSEVTTALDGSDCSPTTRDGMARGEGGRCQDFGVSTPAQHLLAIGAEAPLELLPDPADAERRAVGWSTYSARLKAQMLRQQFGATSNAGCGVDSAPAWRSVYYVNTVPLIGFGSVIEYGLLFLVRATALGSQLVFGHSSSRGWTSSWFCGAERSLNCYFNLTSCCGVLTLGAPGQTTNAPIVELSRRRNPVSIGLPGFNLFGSAWVSAQLADFFFSHMTPSTRKAVDERRAAVFPRRALVPGQPKCVGVHIRGGDACHAKRCARAPLARGPHLYPGTPPVSLVRDPLSRGPLTARGPRRYCPSNLTASFFGMAAHMRERYGTNRLVLATDNERAAKLCKDGVLGFDCRTLTMQRAKFDDAAFIESRVSTHEDGELSGSTVALDTLADIDMLADCDALVLVLRSAVSRLAHHLALARTGRNVPLISLQYPTSSGYAKTKGKKGGKGKFKMARGGAGRMGQKQKFMRAGGGGGRGGRGDMADKRLRRKMKLQMQKQADVKKAGDT